MTGWSLVTPGSPYNALSSSVPLKCAVLVTVFSPWNTLEGLLITQRNRRIHSRRATRGHEARRERHRGQGRAHRAKRDWIRGSDTVQHSPQNPGERDGHAAA